MNNSKVEYLVNKSLKKPINITFNPLVFNLFINDGLGNVDVIVKGLNSDFKINDILN